VFWTDGSYFRAGRDRQRAPVHLRSRDTAAEERLEILNDREGVWRCRTIFNCTEACRRGIEITKASPRSSRRYRTAGSETPDDH